MLYSCESLTNENNKYRKQHDIQKRQIYREEMHKIEEKRSEVNFTWMNNLEI